MPPFIQAEHGQQATKWVNNEDYPRYTTGGFGMEILGTPVPLRAAPVILAYDNLAVSGSLSSRDVKIAGRLRGGDIVYLWACTASSGSSNPDADTPPGFDIVAGPLFNVGGTGRSAGGTLFKRVCSGEEGFISPDNGLEVTVTWPTAPNIGTVMYVVVRGEEDAVVAYGTYDGNPYTFNHAGVVEVSGIQLIFCASGIGGHFDSVTYWTGATELSTRGLGSSNAAMSMAYADRGPGSPQPSVSMDRNANNNNAGWVMASVIIEGA